VRAAVAVVLLLALLAVVGVGEMGDVLLRVEPGALLLSAPLILGAWLLSGLALWALCRGEPGSRPPLREFLPPYAASTFVALWLPGRVGDFSIVYLLRRRFSVTDSLSFVIVDKLLSIVALTLCAVLAVFVYGSALAGALATACFVAACAATLYTLTHRRAAALLLRTTPRALRPALAEGLRCLHRVLERGNHPALLVNFALKLLRVLLVGLLMVVLVDGFGEDLSLRLATVGAAAVQLLSLVPVSVQGLGVQEFAYLYVYDLEQVSHASVVLASFASRLVSIAVVAALYVLLGGSARPREDAPPAGAESAQRRPDGDGSGFEVCYVLSYRAPDYIRTRNVLDALESMPDTLVHRAINTRHGLLRYFETLAALRRVLRAHAPRVLLVGFRGNELYPLVRLLAPGRRIVLDAMMSPSAAMMSERGPIAALLGRCVLFPIERWMLRDCALVLTDTGAHARHMSRLFGIPLEKFAVLPVAAEERCPERRPEPGAPRTILFYGSFLPLHGFDVILEAMRHLDGAGLRFSFIGIRGAARARLDALVRERPDLDVVCLDYVPFEQLLEDHLARAWLFLGGPFGGTPQAQRVITGKAAQALCAGVPVVIGENEETRQLTDRHDCLLVPQGDARALAGTIEWARAHEDRLDAIGRNGARFYHEHLSLAVVRRVLQERLQRLAGQAVSGSCR
jgi:glycosyltransferase involved in cell wall biosynthesis